MPLRRDNDDERLARLEKLMEEYRAKSKATFQGAEQVAKQSSTILKQAKASAQKVRQSRRKV